VEHGAEGDLGADVAAHQDAARAHVEQVGVSVRGGIAAVRAVLLAQDEVGAEEHLALTHLQQAVAEDLGGDQVVITRAVLSEALHVGEVRAALDHRLQPGVYPRLALRGVALQVDGEVALQGHIVLLGAEQGAVQQQEEDEAAVHGRRK